MEDPGTELEVHRYQLTILPHFALQPDVGLGQGHAGLRLQDRDPWRPVIARDWDRGGRSAQSQVVDDLGLPYAPYAPVVHGDLEDVRCRNAQALANRSGRRAEGLGVRSSHDAVAGGVQRIGGQNHGDRGRGPDPFIQADV